MRQPHERDSSRRRTRTRRLLAAAALLALASGFAAARASAHAVLLHTGPHSGATLESSPGQVQLDFNEAVEASFGAIRLFDADGDSIPTGEPQRPGGDAAKLAVAVAEALPRGVYTVTYRVISADGHPVSGGFSFGVQAEVRTTGRTAPNVAALLDRDDTGRTVEIAHGVARALQYAALLLLIGSVFFTLAVWRPADDRRWPLRTLVAAVAAGAGASLAGLLLQGAVGAGVDLGDALSTTVLEGALDTGAGEAWAVRGLLWLLAGTALALFERPARRAAAVAVLAGCLVATLPAAGHAGTQSPQAVLVPADLVHVIAAGAWLGGLVLLLVTYWPRRAQPLDEAAAGATAAATARFSRLALPAIVALAAAGLLQSWFYLDGDPGELFSNAYGLLLLAKVALLALILAIASRSRKRTARLLNAAGGPAAVLRRLMLTEVVVAVAILGVTAALVREAPPAAVNGGPATRSLDLGPLRTELVIEPATTGPNDYHLYFFDRQTGAQVDRVKEVTLRLAQPDRDVGPISLEVPYKNAAHYELLGPALGVPGRWEVALDVRVSKFDAYTARTEIEVAPR